MLKIGALSSRSGLTVRTLHHYDDLGLLCPSHRSDSGFRLYTDADVVRLHRIQALKQMGCSLAEIKAALDGQPCSGLDMIARQMTVLREQQRQLAVLVDRLDRLQRKMDQGGEAVMADWLDVLEMMMIQEKHLSSSEMASLQAAENREGAALEARWRELAARVQRHIDDGDAPETAAAQALSWEWIKLGEQLVGEDAQLAASLDALQHAEPRAQALNGITPAVMAWVTTAFAHARASLIAPYVTPEELVVVRKRMVATMGEWPPLFAEASACLNEGLAPDHPRMADLADRWQALFRRAHSGEDNALDAKVQRAFHSEPDLMIGMRLPL